MRDAELPAAIAAGKAERVAAIRAELAASGTSVPGAVAGIESAPEPDAVPEPEAEVTEPAPKAPRRKSTKAAPAAKE